MAVSLRTCPDERVRPPLAKLATGTGWPRVVIFLAVDPSACGAVLRYRDLDFVWATRFRQMLHEVDAVLEPAENVPSPNQIEIIGSMLHDDEEYRGVVTNSARIGDGYALVRVINGKVEGLTNGPESLIKGRPALMNPLIFTGLEKA